MRHVIAIALAALSGCAAQPQYVTPAVQQQQERADSCTLAFSTLFFLTDRGTPVIRRCIAGDRLNCAAFAMMSERAGMPQTATTARECLETGRISPYDPLVVRTTALLPEFTRQMDRMTRELTAKGK